MLLIAVGLPFIKIELWK